MIPAPPPQHITINGIQTSFRAAGSGDVILMLHGWGANGELLWPLAAPLSDKGFTVYVPDLPGFGGTPPPNQTWPVYDYVKFLQSFMQTMGLETVHLFGHSFGGRLSIVMGAQYADSVQKIVLCDAAGIKPRIPLHKQIPLAVNRLLKNTVPDESPLGQRLSHLREQYRKRAGSEDYLNAGPLKETFLAVIAEDLQPLAAQIQRPTLLLWGENDEDTPLWQAKTLEAVIPDAGLVVFPGAGHYSYLDALPDAIRVIDYFFKHDA